MRQFNWKSENSTNNNTFLFSDESFSLLFVWRKEIYDFFYCKYVRNNGTFHELIFFFLLWNGLRKRWMDVVFGFFSLLYFGMTIYPFNVKLQFVNSQKMRSRNLSLHCFSYSEWWDVRQNDDYSLSLCIGFYFISSARVFTVSLTANVNNFTT